MTTELDFAAFQDMERNGLNPGEWSVGWKEGWPRGGKRAQYKRYELHLAAKHGVALADPATPIVIATTGNLADKFPNWQNISTDWSDLKAVFLNHEGWAECETKEEASAFCGVELLADTRGHRNRNNKSVVASYLEISDHDDGQTMAESEAIAQRNCKETVIVPTFNFGATKIAFRRDEYIKWAKASNKPVEMTEALGREYLESTGKLLPRFARTATYDGAPPFHDPKDGFVYVFGTMPREKHRCLRPRKSSLVVAEYMTGDTTHQHVIDAFKEATGKSLKSLGGTFDPACTDLAHAYYYVAKPKDRSLPKPIYVQGGASDFKPFFEAALATVKAKQGSKQRSTAGRTAAPEKHDHSDRPAPVECAGRDLVAWYVHQKSFDFEGLFAAQGLVKGDRAVGGVFVECFHDNHSGNDSETFLVNSDGEKGFALHCSGASGGCPEITDRLARLAKYVEAGKIDIEDLENPEYGGGPIPLVKPTKDAIRAEIVKLDEKSGSDDLDAVAELIARLGDELFDEEAYDLVCTRTGKRVKSALRKKIAALRREARSQSHKQVAEKVSCDTHELFCDWDMQGEAFADTCEKVIQSVITANAIEPRLFAMGQGPSRLVKDGITGQLVAEPLCTSSMRHEIGQVARFVRMTKKDGTKDFPVPDAIAQHVSNTPNIPLPILLAITDVPFFDRGGTLVTKPGYHAASKIYYQPPEGFALAPIPDAPTDEDIEFCESSLVRGCLRHTVQRRAGA